MLGHGDVDAATAVMVVSAPAKRARVRSSSTPPISATALWRSGTIHSPQRWQPLMIATEADGPVAPAGTGAGPTRRPVTSTGGSRVRGTGSP